MIRKKLSKLNETLLDLIIGIIFVDVIVAVLGIIITKGNIFFLFGAAIGMIGAIIFSSMILYYIEGALDMKEKSARTYILRGLMLRSLIVILIGIVAVKISVSCLIGFIIALMGIKISAFMQPVINRWITKKITGSNEQS